MFEIFEDSDRSYIDIIIARYVKAMSHVEHLCDAINGRGSINNIQTPNVNINPQNIQEALDAIDKHDKSKWVIHDPKRVGMHLNTSLNMSDEHFEFFVKLIKPSEIIKMESAYCEAINELAYSPYLHDKSTMKDYNIQLHCSENGILTYHIKSPSTMFNGEITLPLEKYDFEQLNSNLPYIYSVLSEILERIALVNETHVDVLISNGFFQKYRALHWTFDDPEELIKSKNQFMESVHSELSKLVINDLHNLFAPLIPEFQQFLNPATIAMFNEFDNRPVEKINAYVDLMYKRAVLIQQIPVMQVEIPTTVAIQQPSNNDLSTLSLDELEQIHHNLYEYLLSFHPNLNEVKQNINIVLNQITEYAKINLTLQEQWFTQKNVFEKQIDEAFMPSTYVRIYDEMAKACSVMQSTVMDLEIKYETLWNTLVNFTQQHQLPLRQTAHILAENLLQLTKADYDLEIEKLNAMITSLNDGLIPLLENDVLSNYIDIEALISQSTILMNNLDGTITEEQTLRNSIIQIVSSKNAHPNPDGDFKEIPLYKPNIQTPSEESKASSILLDSFLGFFNPKPLAEAFSDLVISETELRQLKDICRAPYEAFLLSKANKTIKEEKITVANQAIQEIEQSQSPSEILKAIDKSIMDAGYAKISWLGAKTGELVKATMLAKNNFNTHIETLQKKSSQTP